MAERLLLRKRMSILALMSAFPSLDPNDITDRIAM
jgi:hypothetical protein